MMNVARSVYYYKSKEKPLFIQKQEADLRDRIEEIACEFPCYGYRRITAQLHSEGYHINHKKVLRIMRESSLLCVYKRAYRRTTDSKRQPPSGCIHHSDQGVQYASIEYVNELRKYGFKISMAAKGNPYENAMAESFIKTLKHEEVNLWDYRTLSDVLERIPFFIQEVYNEKRLHSSLGYMPPDEFEPAFTEKEQPKLLTAITN